MDIYTVDRNFRKRAEIDVFESAIWTERYLGDGDFQLSVPAGGPMDLELERGVLVMCAGSDQPMILETRDIKDGLLKTSGISLTQWLNNRTVRVFSTWAVKEWNLGAQKPGYHICYLVSIMCVAGSPIFDGTWPIGIPVLEVQKWIIPNLVIGDTDTSGPSVTQTIPFGPGLYDVIKAIAEAYSVGMKIVLEFATDSDFEISFNTYSGADRTSTQSVNPTIRFSEEMNTFTDVQDMESVADTKTHIYVFAPSAPPGIITYAGYATNNDAAEGFDLRVLQTFADDIDTTGMDAPTLVNVLNQKAVIEAGKLKAVKLVDGQLVQTGQIEYGEDYFLGDVVEVEGNSGIVQKARITEYIRSKDSAGSRAYPTLAMID